MVKKNVVVATAVLCATLSGCMQKQSPVSPEPLQGNCVGRILDSSEAPIQGASILLIPEHFSPFPAAVNASGIDSTLSDEYGRYAFSPSESGTYNLFAARNDYKVMQRKLLISTHSTVLLDDNILQKTGSFSGSVHLQGESNHSKTVLLLPGTNTYTIPIDSTGIFSFPALAPGIYTLKALASQSGFASVETTVIVEPGITTSLPDIHLNRTCTTTVSHLNAAYDETMMTVTLTWPLLDTASVTSYRIYCNYPRNPDPLIVVGELNSSITFDLFKSTVDVDTFTYQISVTDADNAEGPLISAETFVKTDFFSFAKYIPYQDFSPEASPNLSFDEHQNIYIKDGRHLAKYDSNGVLLAQYMLSGEDRNHIQHPWTNEVQVDAAGYVYIIEDSGSTTLLIKCDSDLNPVSRLTVDNDTKNFSYIVSHNGSVCFYIYGSDSSLISVYNADFTLSYEYTPLTSLHLLHLHATARSGDTLFEVIESYSETKTDTIFAILLCDSTLEGHKVVYYKDFFTNDLAFLDSYLPEGYHFMYSYSRHCTGTIFMIPALSSGNSRYDCVQVYFNHNGQVLVRRAGNLNDVFDRQGNLYTVDDKNSRILKYSMRSILETPE